MSNTLSTLSIGFVGDNQRLMGSIEESIGGVGRLAQTAGGILVPAFANVSSAGRDAESGLGRLEQLIEVLGLRVMATSTQISNLAQSSRRMGGANRGIRTSANAATEALHAEQAAAANLAGTLSQLSRQASVRSRDAVALQVIDEDREMSRLMRLRTEIRLLSEQQAREDVANRITAIGGEMSTLSAERENPNLPGSRQIEISERLQALASERLQLDTQLRMSVDQRSETATKIAANQQQMNSLLEQESRTQRRTTEDHRRMVAERQRAARTRLQPPPSLTQTVREYRQVSAEIRQSDRLMADLNARMRRSVGNAEELARLETQSNAERVRGADLRERQLQLQGQGHAQLERGRTLEQQVAASVNQQADAGSRAHQVARQYTQRLNEHIQRLRELVRLGRLTNEQAREQEATFRRINNQQMVQSVRHANNIAGGVGRMNFAMQQFGFMIEDGASQMGTRGLAGAVGAMSNNLTAMVGVLARNPMTLIFTSIGVAVTQLLLQTGALEKAFSALGFGAKELEKDNEALAKSIKAVSDAQRAAYEQSKKLAELKAEKSSTRLKEGLADEKQALREHHQELQAIEAKVQLEKDAKRKEAVEAELAATGDKQQFLANKLAGGGDRGAAVALDLQERNRAAQKELDGINARAEAATRGKSALEIELEKKRQEVANSESRIATGEMVAAQRKKQEAEKLKVSVDAMRHEADVVRQSLKEELSLREQLVANREKVSRLDADIKAKIKQADRGGVEAERRLSIEKDILDRTKQMVEAKKTVASLEAKGAESLQKADDLLSKAKERAGAEESEEERRTREHQKYTESLDRAVKLETITVEKKREALSLLNQVHRQERLKEKAEQRKKELKEQIKATAEVPQVQSGVTAGSAEAQGILNQALVDGMQATMQEPLVAEMQQVSENIKKVEAAIKGIKQLNLKKKN